MGLLRLEETLPGRKAERALLKVGTMAMAPAYKKGLGILRNRKKTRSTVTESEEKTVENMAKRHILNSYVQMLQN